MTTLSKATRKPNDHCTTLYARVPAKRPDLWPMELSGSWKVCCATKSIAEGASSLVSFWRLSGVVS